METTIYLLRHGAVEEPWRNRFIGSTDVPLSSEGAAQIRKARDFIAGNLASPPAAVYCSKLQRAVASATLLGEPWSIVPELVVGLNELDFGRWEKLSYREIEEGAAADLDRWLKSPFSERAPGGECLFELRERAVAAFGRIKTECAGRTAIVVAHGGVNRVILCDVMGIPHEHIFHIEQDYAAVNIINYFDDFPVVKLLNGVMR